MVTTEQFYGHTTLVDVTSGLVFVGRVAFMSDCHGRSEVHVINDETGKEGRLAFHGDAEWQPVAQIIDLIRDVHTGIVVEVNHETPQLEGTES